MDSQSPADRLRGKWEERDRRRRKKAVIAMMIIFAAEMVAIWYFAPWNLGEPTGPTAPVHIVTPRPAASLGDDEERIKLTAEERKLIAAVVMLEDGGDCAEGQQAVAEVIINRVLSADFPDTVTGVLEQDRQFDSMPAAYRADAEQEQFDAVDKAVYYPVLPEDVVFFALMPENENVYCRIGEHYFCYGYDWEGK